MGVGRTVIGRFTWDRKSSEEDAASTERHRPTAGAVIQVGRPAAGGNGKAKYQAAVMFFLAHDYRVEVHHTMDVWTYRGIQKK